MIQPKLTLRENGLCFLTCLGEGDDWVPADGDATAFVSYGKYESFRRGADAHAEAGEGLVGIEALSA